MDYTVSSAHVQMCLFEYQGHIIVQEILSFCVCVCVCVCCLSECETRRKQKLTMTNHLWCLLSEKLHHAGRMSLDCFEQNMKNENRYEPLLTDTLQREHNAAM